MFVHSVFHASVIIEGPQKTVLRIHNLKMTVYELLKLLWQKWAGAFSCKATTLHYMQAAVETQKTGFSFKQNLV